LERDGNTSNLPRPAEPLIAYLGLVGRVTRSMACGALWPHSDESRASGSLQTCLWRLGHAWPGLVQSQRGTIALTASLARDTASLELRGLAPS